MYWKTFSSTLIFCPFWSWIFWHPSVSTWSSGHNDKINNFSADRCSSYCSLVWSLLHQETQGFSLFPHTRKPTLRGSACQIAKFYQLILAGSIHLINLYSWVSEIQWIPFSSNKVLDYKGNRKVKHYIMCLCITNTLLRCSESCTVQFPPKNSPRVLITLCTAGTTSQELWAEQNLCMRAVTPKKQLWLALGDFSKGCKQPQEEWGVSQKSWEWLL